MPNVAPPTSPAAEHPSPRHRRRTAVIGGASVLAGLALLAAACGGPPSSGNSSGGQAANTANTTAAKLPPCPLAALKTAEAKGPVKITLWYGGLAADTQQTMEDEVKAFNASQNKIILTANNQGSSYGEVLNKYEGAAATPSQEPGVIYLEDVDLGEMVNRGQVLPAESCMKADHYDETQIQASARSTYSVNNVLWPGYMNISTPVLYYNKVHFKKAGLDISNPPQTLEEVYQDAKKIKAAGVTPKPFVLSIKRWFFETWLDGIGNPIVNNGNGHDKPATKAVFDTPAARKMMDLFVKMKKEGLINLFPDTAGSIDHYLALISKPPQSSMLLETSSASTTIRSVLQGTVTASEISSANIDTSGLDTSGIIPATGAFPGINGPGAIHPSGGAFYILNTDSPAQQAASWEFLKFMLQPKNGAEWYTKGAYLPAVKQVADLSDVQKFESSDLAGALLKPSYEQFVQSDPDQPGPLIGPYQDFTTIIEKAMDDILLNNKPVDSTLAGAQTQATKLLQDYNAH